MIITGNYTIDKLYKEFPDKVKKLENNYIINDDLYLESANLISKNENIVITGEYLQIDDNSSLTLGEIDYNTYSTYNGSTLSCPNIKFAYGFGNKNIIDNNSQSGNLFVYGSKINIPGFWAFFNDNDKQKVEIVNSLIEGFGRISGKNSILFNNTFEYSNGRYGIITPRGKIKLFKNNISLRSIDYNGYRSSIYFNPRLSPGLIIEGGIYDGYDTLFYCENNPYDKSSGIVKIINADIRSSLKSYFVDDTTEVQVIYTANIKLIDEMNRCLPYTKILIKSNDIEEEYITDENGKVTINLIYYRQNKYNENYYLNYKLIINNHEFKITTQYYNYFEIKICNEDNKYDKILNNLELLKSSQLKFIY